MTDESVPLRVQVAPLGFEYARLREPVMRWRADKVVAVTYDDGAPMPYLDDLLAELDASDRIELETRSCDIFDLYDALGTVARVVADHPGDDVYVNLSAGSKVTAIAGMLACMATGATPLYARPDYGPDGRSIPDEPLHDAVAEVVELPTYPIDAPSAVEVAVLDYVERNTTDAQGRYRGVSKKDLVAFVRESSFPFVEASEATTEKGYYRLLDRNVLDPFAERGYVETERVGRRKFVRLTEEGRNALRAFGYLL